MVPSPDTPFLAHISEDGVRRQSLAEHCRNVAAFCKASGESFGMPTFLYLIGLLHDAGKAKLEFLQYLQSGDPSMRGKINHSACGARLSSDRWREGGGIKALAADLIALTICSHHGGMLDCLDVEGNDLLHSRVYPQRETRYEESLENYCAQCAPLEELDTLFEKGVIELTAVLQKMGAEGAGDDVQLCCLLGMLARLIYSCLIDADRWDSYLFEADQNEEEYRPDWDELDQRLEAYLQTLAPRGHIDLLRQEISADCLAFAQRESGTYRLLVPTGGGKTFSSLRFALAHAKAKQKQHIFYLVPYKTIIEQNAQAIRKALGIAQGEPTVLEHHSDVAFGEEDDEDEALKKWQLLTQRWDSPIILTTMVQFLEALFSGKSQAARRFHVLADSVLILDEVQSLPVKDIHLFNMAINFLRSVCGATVVLCTATQPELGAVRYPLHYTENGDMIAAVAERFAAFRRTRIIDRRRQGGYDLAALSAFVQGTVEKNQNTLVVLNTKAAAKKLFVALRERSQSLPEEERPLLYHLSTSMCPEHRLEVLETIKGELHPGGRRLICISTQLIEAGVDISFACVVRSLAGLDSIAQAAGRCNRNGESDQKEVYVVNCDAQLEQLGQLREIRLAQNAAQRVLDEFKEDPGAFDNDLLSPKAMSRFYFYNYGQQASEMNYTVQAHEVTIVKKVGDRLEKEKLPSKKVELFDLYSKNMAGRSNSKGEAARRKLDQAFATAGKLFKAIDSDTRAVIVPYGTEGKALAAELLSEESLKQAPRLLRKAQRFAVNLWPESVARLQREDALLYLEDMGIVLLKEGFYSAEFGVNFEGGEELDLLLH